MQWHSSGGRRHAPREENVQYLWTFIRHQIILGRVWYVFKNPSQNFNTLKWIVHLQKEGMWFCTKPLWFCASHGPYAQRLILGKYHFCSGVNSQPESRKICFHNVGMKCHQPGRCCCMENAWFCSRVDRGNKTPYYPSTFGFQLVMTTACVPTASLKSLLLQSQPNCLIITILCTYRMHFL